MPTAVTTAIATAVHPAQMVSEARSIRLGSSVTVLSTDDPVRVFQQFATLDAVSGGRAEITAGRGSSTESFPLFDYDLDDYDQLYAEKLDLLLRINALDEDETITWRGTSRPPLTDALVVPRPLNGPLPIWIGTGGSPGSSIRAGRLGLPIAYGIIGGQPATFAPLAERYREAAAQAGHSDEHIRVAVANPGYLDTDGQRAKDYWYDYWLARMKTISELRGFPTPDRSWYDRTIGPDAAFYVGEPEEIAERIIRLHANLGHVRQILEVDYGQLPQRDFLRTIELLGTRVKPLVDAERG